MGRSSCLTLLCVTALVVVQAQLDLYPGQGDRYPGGEVGVYPGGGDIYPDSYPGGVDPYPDGLDSYPDGPYPYPGAGPYPDEGIYPGSVGPYDGGLDTYPGDYSPLDYIGGPGKRYGNPFKDPYERDIRKYRAGWQYGLTAEDIAYIIREKAFPANMHIVPKPVY